MRNAQREQRDARERQRHGLLLEGFWVGDLEDLGVEVRGVSLTNKGYEWLATLKVTINGQGYVLFASGETMGRAISLLVRRATGQEPSWRADKFFEA